MLPILSFVPGSSLPFALTVTADETGRALDSLAGYTIRSTVRRDPFAPESAAIFRASTEPGADVQIVPVGQTAAWEIPPAFTALFARGDRVDVQIVTPQGRVDTLSLEILEPILPAT
jgi:hypothetical protein